MVVGGPAAAALPPPPAACHAASGGSVAVLLGQGEDPKILALSKALEALDVGLASDCLEYTGVCQEADEGGRFVHRPLEEVA